MAQYSYLSTREVVDFSTIDPGAYSDKVILCINAFAWECARAFLRSYGLRKINYGKNWQIAGYDGPSLAEWDNIDAAISEALGESDMSCDLTTELQAMTAAIIELGNCGSSCGEAGSGGAPTKDPPPIDDGDNGVIVPPGFPDRTTYETYKCKVANTIIASIRDDMDWLSTANLVGTTAAFLVGALFTPIPFDDILLAFGFIVAIFAQGLLASAASIVSTWLTNNAQDRVCCLYNAPNTERAMADFQAAADNDLSAVEAALLGVFLNNYVLNALFERTTTLEGSSKTMGVDCGTCVCPVFGSQWTIISRDATTLVIESLPGATEHFAYGTMACYDLAASGGDAGPWGPYCGVSANYTAEVISGVVSHYQTRDDSGDEIVPAWTPWNGTLLNISADRHFWAMNDAYTTFRLRLIKV